MSGMNTFGQIKPPGQRFFDSVATVPFGAVGRSHAQSNGLKSTPSSLQPPTVSDGVPAANIGRGVKHNTNPSSGLLEIRQINPPARVIRTLEIVDARFELIRFAKRDLAELEFLAPYHLVILLIDGLSKGCEWRDWGSNPKIAVPGAQ